MRLESLTLPRRGGALLLAVLLAGCACQSEGPILDEAKRLGLTADDFPELAADVLEGMDPGVELSPEGIKGRNTWVLWTGGSEAFLDWLAREGYGISDTLKLLDSRNRDRRFRDLGLVNEPGFEKADAPDRYGLWLDVPADGAEKGRIDRAIEAEGIDERVYGRSTGVLGMRLFPNPAFDAGAAAAWDADRFYEDEKYATSPGLVRPYRVGMTCGLCHVAPHPLRPPADPENPDWENLASALGNQYFREGRVFASNLEPPAEGERSRFLWEILNAQPAGTSDTSRMATDHINNPNAINAIFNLDARVAAARANPAAEEKVGEGALLLPEAGGNPRFVPHILKDGSDSVGIPGATIRVYINIGLFSEYWLTRHTPLLGVRYQKPFEIAYAQENSVYWQATERRLENVAAFLFSVKSMPLAEALWIDAEGNERSGAEMLAPPAVIERGGTVFARTCAGCHSSQRPPAGMDPRSEPGKAWFEASAGSGELFADNFFSDDARRSVEVIGTNAARSFGSNAKRDHVWDNFSSETYKALPAVKRITTYNPLTGKDDDYVFDLADRGIDHSVGYYRTASLIGVWSSAPLLHTNALGAPSDDPSVEGRLAAFEDAMQKLLWPEKRPGVETIWRTRHESELAIPLSRLPDLLARRLRSSELAERRGGEDFLVIGPIPRGTPINLLASLDLSIGSLQDAKKALRLVGLAREIRDALVEVEQRGLYKAGKEEELWSFLRTALLPSLLENSNCTDLVMDRGHTFGEDLPDADKLALIEFLKTV